MFYNCNTFDILGRQLIIMEFEKWAKIKIFGLRHFSKAASGSAGMMLRREAVVQAAGWAEGE